MKLKIFTVYDSKAEGFIQPFFSPTTATAIRSFESACNDQGHEFYRYGADYTLFELGEFCQDTAEFNVHPTPVSLGLAVTFMRETPPTIDTTPNLPSQITQIKEVS